MFYWQPVIEPILPSAVIGAVEKPSASSVATAAEIVMVADEIADDINALKDILRARTGIDLPASVVEKVMCGLYPDWISFGMPSAYNNL